MNKKKMTINLGIVLIIMGVMLMMLSYFYSQVTLGGWSLSWYGGILIIIGFLFVFAYRIGYLPT